MFKNFSKCGLLWAIISVFLMQHVYSNEGSPINDGRNSTVHYCIKKHYDGTPYKGPCPSADEVGEQNNPVTDSEVPDLLKHKSTEKPSNTTIQVNGNNYTAHVEPLSSVDELVKPKEKLNTNSRFNIRTGGIAALTCVSIALVFYVGVMVWKQVVMSGYQNREILLNDDDIGDINDEDMRHFELKFLDKEGRVIESPNGR